MDNIKTINLEQLKESYKVIVNALNTSCKSGVFTLDDSYLLKIATSNFEKTIKIIEISQNREQENDNSI